MEHMEIVKQFESLLRLNTYFKEVEAGAGADAQKAKKKLSFSDYVLTIRRFDRGNKPQGRLDNELHKLIIGWDNAKPDFLPNGMPLEWLIKFSKETEGKSERMESQMILAELLEVKNLFKVESDTFDINKIKRVEQILKRMKK